MCHLAMSWMEVDGAVDEDEGDDVEQDDDELYGSRRRSGRR